MIMMIIMIVKLLMIVNIYSGSFCTGAPILVIPQCENLVHENRKSYNSYNVNNSVIFSFCDT